MRVTNSMLVSSFMNNLNMNMATLGKIQNQLATNRKFANISDDPVGVIYSLQSRYKLDRLEQYQRSLSTAQSWLTQTETGVMEANEILKNIYEQTVDAATDVKTDYDREQMAYYYKQMQDQLVSTLNSAYGDKFVFGNYNTTGSFPPPEGQMSAPFSTTTTTTNEANPNYIDPTIDLAGKLDPADIATYFAPGQQSNPIFDPKSDAYDLSVAMYYRPEYFETPTIEVTRTDLHFCGINLTKTTGPGIGEVVPSDPTMSDADAAALFADLSNDNLSFTIGLDLQIPVTVNGINLVGYGEDNLFNMLDNLYNTVKNGNPVEDLQNFIDPLQLAQEHVLSIAAEIGGRDNRMDMISSRYEQDFLNYTMMKSDAEDADQAEIIMNYKMAEAVYKAALSTGAYIIQPTLMDFLR